MRCGSRATPGTNNRDGGGSGVGGQPRGHTVGAVSKGVFQPFVNLSFTVGEVELAHVRSEISVRNNVVRLNHQDTVGNPALLQFIDSENPPWFCEGSSHKNPTRNCNCGKEPCRCLWESRAC